MTSPLRDSIDRPYDTGRGSALSPEAQTFNWLLESFTTSTAGVVEAVAVSSDGLLMAMSGNGDRANAERLAAVVSGVISLSGGAAHWYSLGGLNRVRAIQLNDAHVFCTPDQLHAEILGVIARSPTDIQPVFDAIVGRAAALCGAEFSAVARLEGGLLHLVAVHSLSPEETGAFYSLFPRPPLRNFVMGRAFVDAQPVHSNCRSHLRARVSLPRTGRK